MGKGGGGRGPDPVKTAQAQYDYNRRAALDSARFNQVNQWTPFGGTYWTGEIGSPDRTQHTVFNPIIARMLFGSSYHPHFGGGIAPGAAAGGGLTGDPLVDALVQSEKQKKEGGGNAARPSRLDAANWLVENTDYGVDIGSGKALMGKGGDIWRLAAQYGYPGPMPDNYRQGRPGGGYGDGSYDPADDYHGGYADGYYGGGSVDPTGADHLGAGGVLDAIDAATGGALSAAHNAGVDEVGGLAPGGPGGAGWGVDPGDMGDTSGYSGPSDAEAEAAADMGDAAGGDAGGDSGGCFLTTAATQMGEADDGPTLSKLRQFRDSYMQETPERREMVQQYYAISPKIVKAIPEGDADWGKVGGAVQGISQLIDDGKPEDAMTAYSDMMEGLSGKYLKGTGNSGPDPMYDGQSLVSALHGGGRQRQPEPMLTVPGQSGGGVMPMMHGGGLSQALAQGNAMATMRGRAR